MWPRSVFETDVNGLHDAKFPVEQSKSFYVCIFMTDNTDGLCTNFVGVL